MSHVDADCTARLGTRIGHLAPRPDAAFAHRALKSFAEGASGRHGCEKPKLP